VFGEPAVSATKFILAGVVLVLALPRFGLCQAASFQGISDDDIDTLDEIVVYGEPSLRYLRNEIYRAEEDFYELFNSLNSGKEFDIRCFNRKFAGSHVRRRICEANFVKGAHAEASLGGRLGQNAPPAWSVIRWKDKQMRREMAELVSDHSELQAALLDFTDSKQAFDVALHERCAGRLSICRN